MDSELKKIMKDYGAENEEHLSWILKNIIMKGLGYGKVKSYC